MLRAGADGAVGLITRA